MASRKVYVLDTSVVVHDPNAIENFGDNTVDIPIWVIQELDKLKQAPNGRGKSARAASRTLEKYRLQGSLRSGVPTENGGVIRVNYASDDDFHLLPIGLERTNDNRILLSAKKLQEENSGHEIILVSKDINLRLKADACGITAEDYKTDKVLRAPEDLYSGTIDLIVRSSSADSDVIERFSEEKTVSAEEILNRPAKRPEDLMANQCCRILNENGEVLLMAIYSQKYKMFRIVSKAHLRPQHSQIEPINMEQLFAFALVMDPNIHIVSLAGQAGTGKTLMGLLGGLEQLTTGRYRRNIIYRPRLELEESMGYLPGDIDEKFAPWTQPIHDAFNLIFGTDQTERGKRKKRRINADTTAKYNDLESYIKEKLLEIRPLNFIRGLSTHHTYVFIDEAQNLTPHQIKTAITRSAKGTKVVLAGDIEQRDSPYLDPLSNGLSHVVEHLKGSEIYGHITLRKTERSELAELGAKLL